MLSARGLLIRAHGARICDVDWLSAAIALACWAIGLCNCRRWSRAVGFLLWYGNVRESFVKSPIPGNFYLSLIGSYGIVLYGTIRFEVKTISVISTTRYGYKDIHRNTLCSSNRHVDEALVVGNYRTSENLVHDTKWPPPYFPHFYLSFFYHGRNSVSLFLYPWVYP